MSPPSIPGFGQWGTGGGTFTGPTTDPSDDPTQNAYYAQRMQTPPWVLAGFPDYGSYAANLRLKEEQARALSQKQLDSNSASSGATVTAAAISTQGANQRAAVQAEIDRAKNAADEAHNAALLALSQGNAAEARRQFDISSKELERYHTADIGLRGQDQQLATAKFGNDVYNKLAELASNPRNYMEQFFRMRGQTPPPNSAQYGNTSVTGPGLATFEQFLPKFLQSTGLAGGGYAYGGGQPAAPQSPAPQANPALSGPSGASTAGLSGFDASGKPRLSPTDPQALGLMAAHPGMYTMTSPQDAQPYIDQLKREGNDSTVYASSYRAPQQFAGGGKLRMTAPHAIVNLLSGKVAAIAGEERGKGPHGFVPETATFDGKAIIDPNTGLPKEDDPTSAGAGTITGGVDSPYTGTVGAPIDRAPGQLPAVPLGTLGALSPLEPATAPQFAADLPSSGGVGTVSGGIDSPYRRQVGTVGPPIDHAPGQLPAVPVGTGGAISTSLEPSTTPPPVFDPTWPLHQTPSGIGVTPQYLPEDMASNDPIIAQMLQSGSFAPFLQRIYAQAKGLAGLGTNVPQQTHLPAGVPLVSKLAYNQMTPSEQSAFQSFLSAHGIDLSDYLSLVEQASPQGGTSSVNPAIPKFLQQ